MEHRLFRSKVAKNAGEAVAIAGKIKGKVVLKIASVDILHKSDVGGVKLNLETASEVRSAYNKIVKNARKCKRRAKIDGCLVSPMVGKGLEVIIGTKNDDQFGPVIMFGLGGIMVEVVKDVVFRVLPLTEHAAKKMITEIKTAPLLNGIRGEPPVNKKMIVDLLKTISDIIEAYPEIREMDLNPVIARKNGITIVDARIILKRKNGNSRNV